MKNVIYILLSIIFLVKCSDMETKWVVKCEPAGPGNYRINGISSLRTDNYITGTYWISDKKPVCITAKYSEKGELLWHTVYEAQDFISAKGYAIRAITSEIIDIKHEIFVLAQTVDSKGFNAMVLVKYDSLGNLLWDKIVQRSRGMVTGALINDYLNNLYVAGWTDQSTDSKEIFIAKYRPSGDLIWQSKYQNQNLSFDTLRFCIGKNGQFIIAGVQKQTDDFFYMKYDSLGKFINFIEHETLGNTSSIADVQTDENGNVYVLGTTNNNETSKDYVILMYNQKDSLILEKFIDGPAHQDDIANALVLEESAAESLFIFVIGSSMNEVGIEEVLTVKYAQSGEQIWTKTFKGRKDEPAEPLQRAPYLICPSCNTDRTNFYITGYVGDDVLVLKHSTRGFISWFTRYSTPGAINRPTAFKGSCVAIESKTERGTDACLMKFGKAEQLGIIRWD
ncbi:MAG: hypothetical protein WBB37_09560 [bacterium]